QHVTVVGTDLAGMVLPHLARQLIALHAQRADVAAHLETIVQAHPLYPVLTSMPGVASGPPRSLLLQFSGKTFSNAAALASY
ncbi:IS110 family transposase, partial [Escherichia coli]|nr:IS110 family transposase [Escherichia coli]